MITQRLPSRLRAARARAGLTLSGLAERTQGTCSKAFICEMESGHYAEPSPIKLRALAQALHLDYIELLWLAGYLTHNERASLS